MRPCSSAPAAFILKSLVLAGREHAWVESMHAHNRTAKTSAGSAVRAFSRCGASVRFTLPKPFSRTVMGSVLHTRRGKQLTSPGKLVTTHSLLVGGFDYVSHLS